MSIPTVVIHVELPAYSKSFDVQVPASATVLDVKHAISPVCIGRPRAEGQRIIWRGRYLDDQEKINQLWPCQDAQRTVHLSVRPSAWTSDPPNTDAPTSPSPRVTHYPAEQTSPVGSQHHPSSSPSSDLDDSLAFIRFRHSQALCWLSNYQLAAPNPLEDTDAKRSVAKLTLELSGYTWPNILDATPPLANPTADTLDYEIINVNGKVYLSLRTPRGAPSPLQVHALNVLTYTFSIISLPLSRPTPTPTFSVSNTASVPPHVNDLLRELGLPPLRAAPNANVDATVQQDVAGAPANPEHAEGNVIRDIPVRALLAPLVMVVFRTVLLLYFFSPTRKPLIGLCVVAWIIYEMWTHVRVVILRPLDRAGGNGAGVGGNGAQAGGAADVAPAAPAAQDNDRAGAGDRNPPRPGGRFSDTEPTRDTQQVQGPPIPRQSNGIVDNLALANVHNENKLLWPLQQPTTPLELPTFLRKAMSFFSLLVVTLHPEVYNRRRVALRQRESRLRTEMNAVERVGETRDNGEEPSEEEQRKTAFRQQLQTQHARRAAWVKRYVERVKQEDWIEE